MPRPYGTGAPLPKKSSSNLLTFVDHWLRSDRRGGRIKSKINGPWASLNIICLGGTLSNGQKIVIFRLRLLFVIKSCYFFMLFICYFICGISAASFLHPLASRVASFQSSFSYFSFWNVFHLLGVSNRRLWKTISLFSFKNYSKNEKTKAAGFPIVFHKFQNFSGMYHSIFSQWYAKSIIFLIDIIDKY